MKIVARRQLVEHHPALDLRRVLKAGVGGHVRVEWELADGRQVAEADIEIDLDELHLRWGHFDHMFSHAHLPYDFERDGSGGPREVWFICPGCQRRAKMLHMYLGKWKCRICHDLRYSSQYTTDYDKTRDKVNGLRDELAGGRPRYMRTSVYGAKRELLTQLEFELSQMKPETTHRGISRRRLTAVYSTDE